MGKTEILLNLISTYGNLPIEKNKIIINEYTKLNPNSVGIHKFINYYNQFTERPIKDDQINMFFRYSKF